jgi:alcohol dehydrogenase/acrylyl-CoA reductase (NADPH)
MILGTAGFTALMMCIYNKSTREEFLLGEKVQNVIVSGASGGVGSMAVMILNKLGCTMLLLLQEKIVKQIILKSIGAKTVINRAELMKDPRL